PLQSGPKIELPAKMMQELKEAFDLFDTNGTGFIDVKDLKVVMRAMGIEPGKEDIQKLLVDTVREGSGLDYADFLNIMTALMNKKDSKEENLKSFQKFDVDGTGTISFQNLKRVAEELGENMRDEELQEMIDFADEDGDGEISKKDMMNCCLVLEPLERLFLIRFILFFAQL
uniref:EF-hand domain-containing protein n=1 Tax=Neogobius melanostomus TaxID=47308 RepID=A0A8C6SFJ3_9GOBI